MAASSGGDILAQLAALLGKEAVRIRKTEEERPRISVIDVATLVTGKDARKAAQDVGFVKNRDPEVAQNLGLFKFSGRAQRNTPVATCRGVVELVMLLPGRHAALVRKQACELLVRYLGGDMSLISEVCALRGLQEELAVRAPEDPARAFGEAVEAAPPAEYLSRVCTDIVGRTVPVMIDKLSSYIDERLAHLGTRQVVNLNVRAPQKAGVSTPARCE